MAAPPFRRQRNWLATTLANLMTDANVQIYGRDGSRSVATPGCTFLDPQTGAARTTNEPYYLTGPGGFVLPMDLAYPAIVNLCPAQSGAGTGLTSNTLSGLARTLVESSGGTGHFVGSASAITLTDSASYTFRVLLGRAAGSRHAAVYLSAGANRAGACVNLDTGAVTKLENGTGTVSVATATRVGSMWQLVCTFTSSAWGGNATVFSRLSDDGTTALSNYSGDGASGVVISGLTVVAGTQTVLGIAEAATRAVDANLWTPPDALTQDEEIIVLGEQDYADGDMGVTTQTWLKAESGIGSSMLFRSGATELTARDYDTATRDDLVTRTLPNRSVIGMQRHRRRTNGIEGGYGRTLTGSPTAGSSFEANTSLRIGSSATAGRAGFGRFGALRFKNGASQAQIDALFFALANGRTVPVVA